MRRSAESDEDIETKENEIEMQLLDYTEKENERIKEEEANNGEISPRTRHRNVRRNSTESKFSMIGFKTIANRILDKTKKVLHIGGSPKKTPNRFTELQPVVINNVGDSSPDVQPEQDDERNSPIKTRGFHNEDDENEKAPDGDESPRNIPVLAPNNSKDSSNPALKSAISKVSLKTSSGKEEKTVAEKTTKTNEARGKLQLSKNLKSIPEESDNNPSENDTVKKKKKIIKKKKVAKNRKSKPKLESLHPDEAAKK